PARGLERPGSGPVADAKMEGAMGAKLDAVLQAPPVGVQVWSSCVAEQYSYEYDYFNNGVFVEELFNALAKGLDGVIQRPEEPLPLSRLVNAVNAQMTAELAPYQKSQASRLTGAEAEGGAAYDPAEPPAVRPEIKLPPSVSMKRVQDILKEVEVPPLKATQDEMALRASSMPLFDPKVMDQYLADEAATPFREAVRKAQAALNTGVKGKRLREEFRVPGDQNKFKE